MGIDARVAIIWDRAMSETETPSQRWRAARVAAVQALYQLDMVEAEVTAVIDEFTVHRLALNVDRPLFNALVEGAARDFRTTDEMIIGALSPGWSIDRLETVLRAILRVGIWELANRMDVPARVVMKEYVDIAGSFFGQREAGMVNGVLDSLAHRLRSHEF